MMTRTHLLCIASGGVCFVLAILLMMFMATHPAWWMILTGGSIWIYALLLPLVEGVSLKGCRFTLSRHLEKRRVKRGDTIHISVDIMNLTGKRYPIVRIIDQIPEGMPLVSGSNTILCSFKPYGHATIEYVLRGTKRGVHAVGPVRVEVFSSSGICIESFSVGQPESIMVIPRGRMDMTKMRVMKKKVYLGESVSRMKGSGYDYQGSRRYIEGDELKLIDWNILAKTGEPGTREFALERGETVAMIIDTNPSMNQGYKEMSKLDSCVETSTLLSEELLKQGYKVILAHGSGRYIRAFTRRERKMLLEDLALLNAKKGDDPGRTLAKVINDFPRVRKILVFTDLENAYTLSRVAKKGPKKDITVIVPELSEIIPPPGVEGNPTADMVFVRDLIPVIRCYESSITALRVNTLRRSSCMVISAPVEELPGACIHAGVIP